MDSNEIIMQCVLDAFYRRCNCNFCSQAVKVVRMMVCYKINFWTKLHQPDSLPPPDWSF